ncbi:MAG: hypothetical protein JNL28_01275 [Planctomycetes bacterium]|nr:hypothetical protein [Planctomycetota bacterium]
MKAIDKAAADTADVAARKALGDAREPLSSWLVLKGLTVVTVAPAKPEKRKRNNTAMATA